MNKKIRLLAAGTAIMVSLSGCSLAKADLQKAKQGDKLIGVFATYDEDLKDYDMQNGDTLYYQEKKLVRADGTVKKLSDAEIKGFNEGFIVEGKKKKDGTYDFNQIKGYSVLYIRHMEKDEDGESFAAASAFSSENVYDVKSSINISDFDDNGKTKTETESKIEAAIGIAAGKEARIRVNRVYQREDGSVYAMIPGSSIMSMNADEFGSGMGISESYETNVSGSGISSKTQKETNSFTINIERMDFLKSAQIRQMDREHNLIKLSEADFSQSESNLKLEDKTDYVIVEENFQDVDGNPYSKRTAYDCGKMGGQEQEDLPDEPFHRFKKLDENGRVEIVDLKFQK